MAYTTTLPTEVGAYRHRYIDVSGRMREQVLFVGYTNASAPRLQGDRPNGYMPRKLKCCQPHQHLHADRLTPAEWGGWWERLETHLEEGLKYPELKTDAETGANECADAIRAGAKEPSDG